MKNPKIQKATRGWVKRTLFTRFSRAKVKKRDFHAPRLAWTRPDPPCRRWTPLRPTARRRRRRDAEVRRVKRRPTRSYLFLSRASPSLFGPRREPMPTRRRCGISQSPARASTSEKASAPRGTRGVGTFCRSRSGTDRVSVVVASALLFYNMNTQYDEHVERDSRDFLIC